MLHFSDPLVICSPVFYFVLLVAVAEGGVLVTLRKGLTSKNAQFRLPAQKSSAAISKRAPSSLLADCRVMIIRVMRLSYNERAVSEGRFRHHLQTTYPSRCV